MNLIIRNYHKFHLRKSLSYNTIVNAKPPRRFEFHHHFYCVIFDSLIFCCKDISRKYIPGIDIQSSTGLVPFDLGIFIFYGQHIYPLHIVEVLIHVKQSLRLITWFAFCPKWML